MKTADLLSRVSHETKTVSNPICYEDIIAMCFHHGEAHCNDVHLLSLSTVNITLYYECMHLAGSMHANGVCAFNVAGR